MATSKSIHFLHVQIGFISISLLFILLSAQTSPSTIKNLDAWKNSKIATQLKMGSLINQTLMQDFLKARGKKVDFEGSVFVMDLDNGLKAVFKSLPKADMEGAYAEVAAYQASIVLGFPNIPPTVIRKFNHMQGSLQLFVDTPIDALAPNVFNQALDDVDPSELADLKVFYFVFGQWDTGPHNMLILEENEKKKLIAIDNSGIANRQHVIYGQLPFVGIIYSDAFKSNDWWRTNFPFEKANVIQQPTLKNLRATFGNKLPERFYKSFKDYNKPFCYVIYQNRLWRQFYAFDANLAPAYTPYISVRTKKALQALDLDKLRKIFEVARGAEFLNDQYLKAILERRDQVINNTKVNPDWK